MANQLDKRMSKADQFAKGKLADVDTHSKKTGSEHALSKVLAQLVEATRRSVEVQAHVVCVFQLAYLKPFLSACLLEAC